MKREKGSPAEQSLCPYLSQNCAVGESGKQLRDRKSAWRVDWGMLSFLFYGDTRPEAQKRRKRWVDWVKLKRAKWEPSEHSHLCSVHFKPEEFMLQFGNEVDLSNKWLQRDELGVCVFPSIHNGAKEKPISVRDKRMVR